MVHSATKNVNLEILTLKDIVHVRIAYRQERIIDKRYKSYLPNKMLAGTTLLVK
jgi:hypothetical protein